jgi:hypothetical protein
MKKSIKTIGLLASLAVVRTRPQDLGRHGQLRCMDPRKPEQVVKKTDWNQ